VDAVRQTTGDELEVETRSMAFDNLLTIGWQEDECSGLRD